MNRTMLAVVVGLLAMSAATSQADTQADLERQLQLLMDWWPGEYDNHEQIVRQSGGGLSKPVYAPHFRVHAHYLRVELPELGAHVLYAEEYKNGVPADLHLARLYSVAIDQDARALRVKPHDPPAGADLAGAHGDPARVEALAAGTLRTGPEACDLLLRFEGGQFRGGTRPGACQRNDAYEHLEIVIGPDYYWFRERRTSEPGGEPAWEGAPAPGGAYFELSRVRWFSCTVNYNLEGKMAETERLATVRLHSEGGVAPIAYPDGRRLSLVLHRRAFRSPAVRRFYILRLHEDGHHVPISYSYTQDTAPRFGMNLGWFYTLCRDEAEPPAGD
jgi:hypothetical protein